MTKNKSPQTFEKRQRERRKQQERDDKFERRLERNAEKRRIKAEGVLEPDKIHEGKPDGSAPGGEEVR